MNAEALHHRIVRAFRDGNRARLTFIRSLRTLQETRLYFELGFPSIVAYAERFFGSRKSQTYEALRVAEALDSLLRCEAAFAGGSIGWSALREITRVAIPATEEEWLALAHGRSVTDVKAEVDHAIAEGKDRPRDRRFGLPDLRVRTVLEMTRSEHEVFRKAMEAVGAEVGDAIGAKSIDLKNAVLHLSHRVLSGDLAQGDTLALRGGDSEGSESGEGNAGPASVPHATLLYHVCPECRRGSMETAEGSVEVSTDVIDRVEGSAVRVTIDPAEELPPTDLDAAAPEESHPTIAPPSIAPPSIAPPTIAPPTIAMPTSAAMRRKILLRDGLRCANPCCRNRSEHCHHIRFRGQGGETELWNEVAVCGRCHALVHAGLLTVSGVPAEGLRWRARGEDLGSEEEGIDEARSCTENDDRGRTTSVRNEGGQPAMASERGPSDSTRVESDPAHSLPESQRGPCDSTRVESVRRPRPPMRPRRGPTPHLDSTRVESGVPTPGTPRPRVHALAAGSAQLNPSLLAALTALGEDPGTARERIDRAIAALRALMVEVTEENVLQEVLCAKAARWRGSAGPTGEPAKEEL